MNENINLCEILKGHEGETFYNSAYGYFTLLSINRDSEFPIKIEYHYSGTTESYTKKGTPTTCNNSECILFPSKDQRDWNKWIEEQKNKTPKTWSELEIVTPMSAVITSIRKDLSTTSGTLIEKSALALLKIHQLIEVGYGGNVKGRDKVNFFAIQWSYQDKRFVIRNFGPFLEDCGTVACFHTKEQAIEFLSYPENVQLLKDYFMI